MAATVFRCFVVLNFYVAWQKFTKPNQAPRVVSSCQRMHMDLERVLASASPSPKHPSKGPCKGKKDFALLCTACLQLRDLGTRSSEYWAGCNKKTPILFFCMIGGNFAAMWQLIQHVGCLGILQRQFSLLQTKEWNATMLALELGSLNKLCPPNRMEQGLATLSVPGKYSYQIPLSVAHDMVVLLSVQEPHWWTLSWQSDECIQPKQRDISMANKIFVPTMPVSNCIHQIAMVIRTSSFCPFWDPESSIPKLFSACFLRWLCPLFLLLATISENQEGIVLRASCSCFVPTALRPKKFTDQPHPQETAHLTLWARRPRKWPHSLQFFCHSQSTKIQKLFFVFSISFSRCDFCLFEFFFCVAFQKGLASNYSLLQMELYGLLQSLEGSASQASAALPSPTFLQQGTCQNHNKEGFNLVFGCFGCHLHLFRNCVKEKNIMSWLQMKKWMYFLR